MTENVDHEAIIAELKREALSDPATGWLSDLARRGLAWEERDDIIAIGDWCGSVDVGHLASVVGVLINEATKPLLSRLEQAEQAVARVREFSRTMLVPHGQGVVVAARVKEALGRALDGEQS